MSDAMNTFDHVKAVILSAHSSSTTSEKVNFYNSWAENYDQVGLKCKTAKVFSSLHRDGILLLPFSSGSRAILVFLLFFQKDVAVLEYRAPTLAANCIASHFVSGRDKAVVLDVACGTGLVAKQVHFQDKQGGGGGCNFKSFNLFLQTNINDLSFS